MIADAVGSDRAVTNRPASLPFLHQPGEVSCSVRAPAATVLTWRRNVNRVSRSAASLGFLGGVPPVGDVRGGVFLVPPGPV